MFRCVASLLPSVLPFDQPEPFLEEFDHTDSALRGIALEFSVKLHRDLEIKGRSFAPYGLAWGSGCPGRQQRHSSP